MKSNSLIISIVWFINAATHFAMICSDFYYDATSKVSFVIHCLAFVGTLVTAIVFLIRYYKTKRQTENE